MFLQPVTFLKLLVVAERAFYFSVLPRYMEKFLKKKCLQKRHLTGVVQHSHPVPYMASQNGSEKQSVRNTERILGSMRELSVSLMYMVLVSRKTTHGY